MIKLKKKSHNHNKIFLNDLIINCLNKADNLSIINTTWYREKMYQVEIGVQ